jgi:hypothetical protein
MSKYGRDKNYYYVQTNNAIEQILKKKNVQSWLENCGPTTAINCIASLGINVEKWPGMQPEDIISIFFNNPANFTKLTSIRNLDLNNYLVNEIPQYYPYMAKYLFNVESKYIVTNNYDLIIKYLKDGNTIQMCLRNPGHYIAAIDTENNNIIYNDPWPGRDGLKNNGFNEVMDITEFDKNITGYFIVYFK